MNKNLLILGAGNHGQVVKETAQAMGIFTKIDFLDDKAAEALGSFADYEKLRPGYQYAFVALGNNQLRLEWIVYLERAGYILPALIHPTAYVSPSASIYPATVVEAKAMINTRVVIEKGCLISMGVIVDHHALIGYGCHLDCGAIVKARCVVEAFRKVESGVVIRPEDCRDSWQKKRCHDDFGFEVGV